MFRLPGQEEFGDATRAVMATGLDDHVDRALDVVDHVGIGHWDLRFQGGDGDAADSKLRGFGMECGQRATMAGIDRLKEGHGLAATNLAQHDPVGPHAQCGRQKHIGTACLGVPVGDQRHGIWLLGAQLGRILAGKAGTTISADAVGVAYAAPD